MPTYEYKCTSCENNYETHEGFDSPPRQPCPRCGAEAKRVFSPPPIVFKGSGFYITDSRKGSSATIGSESYASSDSNGNGSTSSDAKPAPSESKPASAAASSDD